MNHYVYEHFHPVTNEIVYVGKGSGGRAWDTSRNRKFCHPEHYAWMVELMNKGFTPADFVRTPFKGLDKISAYTKEKELIREYGQPPFNRTCGERAHRAKLTNAQAIEIFLSTENSGQLSRKFGVSRACIQHIKRGDQWQAVTHGLK